MYWLQVKFIPLIVIYQLDKDICSLNIQDLFILSLEMDSEAELYV